jgi:hypothetical protein
VHAEEGLTQEQDHEHRMSARPDQAQNFRSLPLFIRRPRLTKNLKIDL